MATGISYAVDLKSHYGANIVDSIPRGWGHFLRHFHNIRASVQSYTNTHDIWIEILLNYLAETNKSETLT